MNLNQNRKILGIGLMAGTSLDGLDIAAVRFQQEGEKWKWNFEVCEHIPYPEQWYARLKCLPDQDGETFWKTHIYFGHFLGKELAVFIKKNALRPDFVASHGQTIFHNPAKGYTAQIGDGETMATYLPCLLVTNFRTRDVALGGQGAPLVPVVEPILFPDIPVFLNLGGIANISFHTSDKPAIGWDIAPCNLITNFLYQQITQKNGYDENGNLAKQGNFNPELYQILQEWPYLKLPPPKSTGREIVEKEIIPILLSANIPLQDILNTYHQWLTEIITETIIEYAPDTTKTLITGGGFHNEYTKSLLISKLSSKNITLSLVGSEIIDFKEALIFAFLGLKTLFGQPNTEPSVTHSVRNAVSGSIHQPGNNANAISLLF